MSLDMRYFVLKPRSGESSDSRAHAYASRKAMRTYAEYIENWDAELAKELRDWVDREGRP
jgi:hypothetical protein